MIVVKNLADIPHLSQPCGLTIGSFDGVHLGHRYLLNHLRGRISPLGTLGVLTFSNHPSEVLTHRPKAIPLCTLDEKLKRLEQAGVDLTIVLPFTQELAQQPYDVFLKNIHACFPFKFLVLGKGASFGKGKQGDEAHVKELGQTLGFQAEYLDKFKLDGEIVSSGRIREALAKGDLVLANKLLG